MLTVVILRFHLSLQLVVVEDNKIDQEDLLTLVEAEVADQAIKVAAVAVLVAVAAVHLLQEHIQIQILLELLVLLDKATVVATDITAGRVVVEQGVQD